MEENIRRSMRSTCRVLKTVATKDLRHITPPPKKKKKKERQILATYEWGQAAS